VATVDDSLTIQTACTGGVASKIIISVLSVLYLLYLAGLLLCKAGPSMHHRPHPCAGSMCWKHTQFYQYVASIGCEGAHHGVLAGCSGAAGEEEP
jgi:hypothetical protein